MQTMQTTGICTYRTAPYTHPLDSSTREPDDSMRLSNIITAVACIGLSAAREDVTEQVVLHDTSHRFSPQPSRNVAIIGRLLRVVA